MWTNIQYSWQILAVTQEIIFFLVDVKTWTLEMYVLQKKKIKEISKKLVYVKIQNANV